MFWASPCERYGGQRGHDFGGQRGGVEGGHGGSVRVGWVRIDEAGSGQHRFDLLREVGAFFGDEARAQGGGKRVRVVLGEVVREAVRIRFGDGHAGRVSWPRAGVNQESRFCGAEAACWGWGGLA